MSWSALFDRPLTVDLRGQALNSLYGWLNSPNSLAWLPTVAAWAFLVIGICLVIGLFTRLASLIGIVLVLAAYLPTISFTSFSFSQLVNDELIAFFCLAVLIFGRAGTYIGIDKFLRWSRRHKE